MNRIDRRFQDLAQRHEPAFIPFLCAGDPDLDTTAKLIREFERRGADVIELGVPFSDPVADGPVIQAAYTRALERGVRLDEILSMVRSLRDECEIPIVSMISYSIVFRRGVERYVEEAASAGIDGATIPDLPIEEADAVFAAGERCGFYNVCFVTPLTPPHRRSLVVERSRGFIYYMSVAGTTGMRDRLPDDIRQNVLSLKSMTRTPVAVGFGISTPEQAAAVGSVADGVIVGSAIVQCIAEAIEKGDDVVARAGELVERLARGAKGV